MLINIGVILVMSLSLVAFMLSGWYAMKWEGRWRGVILMPLLFLSSWTVSVIMGWPTEHNLWPLELIIWGPACMVYIFAVRHLYLRPVDNGLQAGKD